MNLAINPDSRLGPMLEACPALEETLLAMAPAFAGLKNPVLRETVVKTATLEQVAGVAGMSVRDLVLKLRQAAGQAETPDDPAAPAWLAAGVVRFTIDAGAMLATGVHPIGEVRESAAALQPGEILQLASPFRPEPLIETMRRAGFAVYSAETAPGRHLTSIARL